MASNDEPHAAAQAAESAEKPLQATNGVHHTQMPAGSASSAAAAASSLSTPTRQNQPDLASVGAATQGTKQQPSAVSAADPYTQQICANAKRSLTYWLSARNLNKDKFLLNHMDFTTLSVPAGVLLNFKSVAAFRHLASELVIDTLTSIDAVRFDPNMSMLQPICHKQLLEKHVALFDDVDRQLSLPLIKTRFEADSLDVEWAVPDGMHTWLIKFKSDEDLQKALALGPMLTIGSVTARLDPHPLPELMRMASGTFGSMNMMVNPMGVPAFAPTNVFAPATTYYTSPMMAHYAQAPFPTFFPPQQMPLRANPGDQQPRSQGKRNNNKNRGKGRGQQADGERPSQNKGKGRSNNQQHANTSSSGTSTAAAAATSKTDATQATAASQSQASRRKPSATPTDAAPEVVQPQRSNSAPDVQAPAKDSFPPLSARPTSAAGQSTPGSTSSAPAAPLASSGINLAEIVARNTKSPQRSPGRTAAKPASASRNRSLPVLNTPEAQSAAQTETTDGSEREGLSEISMVDVTPPMSHPSSASSSRAEPLAEDSSANEAPATKDADKSAPAGGEEEEDAWQTVNAKVAKGRERRREHAQHTDKAKYDTRREQSSGARKPKHKQYGEANHRRTRSSGAASAFQQQRKEPAGANQVAATVGKTQPAEAPVARNGGSAWGVAAPTANGSKPTFAQLVGNKSKTAKPE